MKRGHRLLAAGVVAVALVVGLGLSASAAGAADPIYVDADAIGGNNGTSWSDAYTDLQAGLDDAEDGDEIWVAAGTYKPTAKYGGTDERNRSFQLKNGVALYGGFDPAAGDVAWGDRDWVSHETILSGDLAGDDGADFANNAENSYHVFYHSSALGPDSSAILDGFTVSGGNANGEWRHDSGGGMFNEGASPTLAHCTFYGNSAAFGGGMANFSSSPELTHCTFSGNSATVRGGGMYNHFSTTELANCTFVGNSTGSGGGGMFNNYSSPALTNCTFEDNSATSAGAMSNFINASPVLTKGTFKGNSATTFGGGMYNWDSSPALANCTFYGNSATYAGGMHNEDSSPTLTNCTFTGNSGYAGGMYNIASSPALTNCILWGNAGDEMSNYGSDSSPNVSHSDIEGGCEAIDDNLCGPGNIADDPEFADPDNGDLHLQSGSPCIDAGDNAAPDLPPYDFEGDARIVDGDRDGTATVDMGVDEALLRAYLPLVARHP